MNERMKAMGDFLLAALQHCEVMLDRKMFNPEAQYNINSDIYKLHRNLEMAYEKYKAEVVKAVNAPAPDFTLKENLDAEVIMTPQ